MIKQAAADTIPQVAPMFWSFRVMIGCGLALLLLYIVGLLLLREEDARHKDALSARHAARIAAALDRL